MSHEITQRLDGTFEMAFCGEKPWHIGETNAQEVERGASIEEWQEKSGMNWSIKRAPVMYTCSASDSGNVPAFTQYSGQEVLYRSDNGGQLGIVSDRYKIVQPADCLEFFRALAESNDLELETAGTLFGGKRLWALAKINEFEIGHGDINKSYLLFSTSCDGTLATTARVTDIRVVCNNTIKMALKGAKADIVIRHNTEFDAAYAQKQLACSHTIANKFALLADKLANVSVSAKDAEQLIHSIMSKQSTKKDIATSNGYKTILDLFNGNGKGSTLDSSANTAWGLLNAATEYSDWHGKEKKSAGHRMSSALWGKGDEFKSDVLDYLIGEFKIETSETSQLLLPATV